MYLHVARKKTNVLAMDVGLTEVNSQENKEKTSMLPEQFTERMQKMLDLPTESAL